MDTTSDVVAYNDLTATLHIGSAKAFLERQPADSVDLIVTSPPYFIGKEYDWSRSVSDFIQEFRATLHAIKRCLKPGGNVCWQVGNHVQGGRLTPLDSIIVSELLSHPELVLRNRIIWTFGHGAHASTRFSGRHETVLWYAKGDKAFFDLEASRVPQRYPGKRHYKGPKKGLWSGNPGGKNPGDVWDIGDVWAIPNVKANHIEKTEHPCQFPTALVRRLVVALSPRGGLVIDPYLGSGTTALSALLEGRNTAGSDLDRRYIAIAKNRLGRILDGTLEIRDDVPVQEPNLRNEVAQKPPHFRLIGDALDG
jgi:adenine-specific DNA-methyltransferase